jgi:hypothetical protein
MVKFKDYVTREIGNFIWDGFTDPAGVGVNMFNILDGASLVGVNLTDAQKDSVLNHSNAFGEWSSNDEEIRDAIANATDTQNYKKMYAWLEIVVGDNTAAGLVKEWEEEAQEILDRFDRVNDCHTMTVKEWKNMFDEELQETEDLDERETIKTALAIFDNLDEEDDENLAVNYVASEPIDFTILPWGATTKAEKRLCQNLALN